MKKTLEWEVTVDERKGWIRKSLKKFKKIWILIALYIVLTIIEVFLSYFTEGFSTSILYWYLGAIVGVTLLIFVLPLTLFKTEKYRLTPEGIYKKKKKEKFYPWSRFAWFYMMPTIPTVGPTFILIKKHSPLIPITYGLEIFVLLDVNAEPDNYKEVMDYIGKYVKKGPLNVKRNRILFITYWIFFGIIIPILFVLFGHYFLR